MTKPLKLIAANDTFGALLAVTGALAGKHALFITAPETNGLMPETHQLPESVDDSVAFVVETSGSTGTPKRVELSAAAALAGAKASASRLGGSGQWLLALPINYVAGLNVLIRSAVAETQPVMMNTAVSFTAEAFVRSTSLMSGSKKFTALVPTQLSRLEVAAEQDETVLRALKSFDAILVGGQASSAQLIDSLRQQGVNVVETYGSAETFGGVVYDGLALDGVQVKISDDSRIQISSAELGDVLMSDLGEIVEGKLRVLGRADRVLISGGIKISLDRVEAIARDIAGVVEIAAAAVEDSEWGERVGIVYLGSPEVADEIAIRLADDLGPAAKPLRIIRADRVPKLSSGKHDLLAIKQLFEKSQSGQ
ncbi:MAG: AMP-binding protein [Rhodoluna sp.]|nr:AMP-binding protein [Rhodoluna sp.]